MKYEKGEELTLDNDKSYIVVDTFDDNGKTYLFLSSEKKDIFLVEVIDDEIKSIDSDIEYDKVLKILLERNKEEIKNLMKD